MSKSVLGVRLLSLTAHRFLKTPKSSDFGVFFWTALKFIGFYFL